MFEIGRSSGSGSDGRRMRTIAAAEPPPSAFSAESGRRELQGPSNYCVVESLDPGGKVTFDVPGSGSGGGGVDLVGIPSQRYLFDLMVDALFPSNDVGSNGGLAEALASTMGLTNLRGYVFAVDLPPEPEPEPESEAESESDPESVPESQPPTEGPTAEPTTSPTISPTASPTDEPAAIPPPTAGDFGDGDGSAPAAQTDGPTAGDPTDEPTDGPTEGPTAAPTEDSRDGGGGVGGIGGGGNLVGASEIRTEDRTGNDGAGAEGDGSLPSAGILAGAAIAGLAAIVGGALYVRRRRAMIDYDWNGDDSPNLNGDKGRELRDLDDLGGGGPSPDDDDEDEDEFRDEFGVPNEGGGRSKDKRSVVRKTAKEDADRTATKTVIPPLVTSTTGDSDTTIDSAGTGDTGLTSRSSTPSPSPASSPAREVQREEEEQRQQREERRQTGEQGTKDRRDDIRTASPRTVALNVAASSSSSSSCSSSSSKSDGTGITEADDGSSSVASCASPTAASVASAASSAALSMQSSDAGAFNRDRDTAMTLMKDQMATPGIFGSCGGMDGGGGGGGGSGGVQHMTPIPAKNHVNVRRAEKPCYLIPTDLTATSLLGLSAPADSTAQVEQQQQRQQQAMEDFESEPGTAAAEPSNSTQRAPASAPIPPLPTSLLSLPPPKAPVSAPAGTVGTPPPASTSAPTQGQAFASIKRSLIPSLFSRTSPSSPSPVQECNPPTTASASAASEPPPVPAPTDLMPVIDFDRTESELDDFEPPNFDPDSDWDPDDNDVDSMSSSTDDASGNDDPFVTPETMRVNDEECLVPPSRLVNPQKEKITPYRMDLIVSSTGSFDDEPSPSASLLQTALGCCPSPRNEPAVLDESVGDRPVRDWDEAVIL